MNKTDIVLLCSEITRGMKSYGPKATILLGKRKEPLIIKQIRQILKFYENCNIHIVVGFGNQKIQKIIHEYGFEYKINFIEHNDYESHNNGGALICGLSECNGDTLFVNNGIILSQRIFSDKCCLPIVNGKNIDKFLIGSTINDGQVQNLFYDLDNRWSEIVFIPSSHIDHIKKTMKPHQNKLCKMFIFEIINYLIDKDIIFVSENIQDQKLQKILTHKNQ